MGTTIDNRLCGAHHNLRGHCAQCREDSYKAEGERDRAAQAFPQALAAMNEWWSENEGGDYYPASERIAAEYGIDVWALRDAWTRPFLAAYRAADEAKAASA